MPSNGQSGGPAADILDPQSAASLLGVLVEAAQRDAAVRTALRRAGQWLVAITEPAVDAPADEPAAEAAPVEPAPSVPMPLRLGNAHTVVPVRDTGDAPPAARPPGPVVIRAAAAERSSEALPVPDLALVKRRTALKAECCRWAIERRRRLRDGADFETSVRQRDQDLVGSAKALPNCYVWPLDPYVSLPDDAELERAAQCYENLNAAADFALAVREADPQSESLGRAYALLAEAQSALRALLRGLELREDADQNDAFFWLRRRTDEDEIYVERYMKINDPASPDDAARLEESLEAARGEWEEQRRRVAARTRLFNKARYHARRLEGDSGPDARRDWQVLCESVAALVDAGLPPSNAELRELLLPIVDQLPDDLGDDPAFGRVLRELDRYLASRELERAAPAAEPPPDANVQRVGALLAGTTVVVIGGERRGETAERLRRTFDLAELRWLSTREHQSTAEFEAAIARPETALVLLAIRWASHSYEDAKAMCMRHGKAYVRLPGGYGANQIAYQVLQQASEELAARRERASA